jgi:hypothetical protein
MIGENGGYIVIQTFSVTIQICTASELQPPDPSKPHLSNLPGSAIEVEANALFFASASSTKVLRS